MERVEFLARVTAALGAKKVPQVPDAPAVPVGSDQDLVAQFVAAASDVGASIHRASTGAEVRELVLGIATAISARSFITWDEAHLGVLGVCPFLEVAGLEEVAKSGDSNRVSFLAAAETADVGVTGSIGGLADSGTLILNHGSGRARIASLLPPVHIAILRADQLHASLVSFCRDNPDALEASSNQVFVTGPSRTGDIEMILTTGVRGPKEVHIVIVE